MMMTSGYFRFVPDLPKVFWRYPISYINYGAWGLQVLLASLAKKNTYLERNKYIMRFGIVVFKCRERTRMT